MRYVGRRVSETQPLRSLPMLRTVESVLGVSPRVKAEAELRIARAAYVGELEVYAAARTALGVANRRPVNWVNAGAGCRRFHQAQAMRGINARRALVRAAGRRLQAAEAAIAALTPADAFATPYLAEHALRAAA